MFNSWVEVDVDKLKHNINTIKQAIHPNTEIMAVVKDDAYQLGAIYITEKFIETGIKYFAVANINEACELKAAFEDIEVLILSHIQEEDFDKAIDKEIIISVSTLEEGKNLNSHAEKLDKKAKVHIKVDTGMNRIGFKYNSEDIKDMNEVFGLEHLEVLSIYSHYSSADVDTEYTNYQKEQFDLFYNAIDEKYRKTVKRHINNSASVGDNRDTDYDFIRPGIIMYGYDVRKVNKKTELDLKPIMEMKAKITHIKTLDAGEAIGYGHTFSTSHPSTIATIAIGYGDGYSRRLSNKFHVLVNGEYAPIVGNICMDQTMIDITGIENVEIGSDAVLIGKDGINEINIEEVAEELSEIPYTILCQIQKRVTRVYMENNKMCAYENYYEGLIRN